MYVVLEFLPSRPGGRREYTVVPEAWVDNNKKMCFWPPSNGEKRLEDLVRQKAPYQSGWKQYNFKRLLFKCSNYQTANERLDNYHTTDQDSESENQDIESTSDSIDENSRENEIKENEMLNVPNATTEVVSDTVGSLLRIVKKLETTICMIKETQDNLVLQIQNIADHIRAVKPVDRPDNLPTFPIGDMASFTDYENHLSNEEFEKYIISRYTALGGTSVEDLTRRILRFTLTNSLGMLCNWKGGHEKMAFENSKCMNCIYSAAQTSFPGSTQLSVANATKDWLKFSKKRHQDLQKKLSKTNN
uniref:DUF4806 domain-containing protein n=1 Tax=Photinus pyralis TaxID=7054 RepID=A0A1Y1KE36_PHOPY